MSSRKREAEAADQAGLDGVDAHLAVALGGVAVADREQRILHEHRQVERGAGDELLVVHVAAELARLDARHRAPGPRRRVRHHAEERAQRNLGAPRQPADHAVALQRHMDHLRLGEVIGQGAFERTHPRVAPVVVERDVLDVDLQHLPGPRPAHGDRAGAHVARQHAARFRIVDVVERLRHVRRRGRQRLRRAGHRRDRHHVAAVDRRQRQGGWRRDSPNAPCWRPLPIAPTSPLLVHLVRRNMMGEPAFRHKHVRHSQRACANGLVRNGHKEGRANGPGLVPADHENDRPSFPEGTVGRWLPVLTNTTDKPDMASCTPLRHPGARMSAMPRFPRRMRADQ